MAVLIKRHKEGLKKCIIKHKIKFEDYKKCLENNEIMPKSKQRFKSEVHNGFLEKVNDIMILQWVQVMTRN